ncbi:MAG TPA: 5-(carboxyamino)imidazole ribonucleotide synthase [Phycisphaerae bacterium]|nr:5-(carboxyamino)imidazole ribonucleotide synthase [Phycisphaerae bacterium]
MNPDSVILPPATIAILGGGQLGAMMCEAGRRMGYRMVVLSEDASDPAGRWADEHVIGDTRDAQTVVALAQRAQVLTNEFEQVPPEVLEAAERVGAGRGCRVAPSSAVQRTCRDRRHEKMLFAKFNFPHGPFAIVESADGVAAAYEKLAAGGGGGAKKVVAKVARGGYDGKGQMWLESSGDAGRVWEELIGPGGGALMLEQAVPFIAEASVIAARSPSGQSASFPMFRNEHRNGILFQTVTPAGFSAETEKKARAYAEGIAEKLGVVGLLAVEMFVLENGDVWMNELAARPHNSGHVTLRATTRSQFEMHIAAICNLPLVPVESLLPGVMTNLLGDLWTSRNGAEPRWNEIFEEPHGTLHLYGKTPRPGRKMGHMIHTGHTVEEALVAANSVFGRLT